MAGKYIQGRALTQKAQKSGVWRIGCLGRGRYNWKKESLTITKEKKERGRVVEKRNFWTGPTGRGGSEV